MNEEEAEDEEEDKKAKSFFFCKYLESYLDFESNVNKCNYCPSSTHCVCR